MMRDNMDLKGSPVHELVHDFVMGRDNAFARKLAADPHWRFDDDRDGDGEEEPCTPREIEALELMATRVGFLRCSNAHSHTALVARWESLTSELMAQRGVDAFSLSSFSET